jgi:hypothetical protein
MSGNVTVLTFLWGARYTTEYVDRLADAVRRNMDIPYRFVCAVDERRTFKTDVQQVIMPNLDLAEIGGPNDRPGCLPRLRLFDPLWQRQLGIDPGDRVMVLDLDIVIVGKLAPLFDRPTEFTILQGVNYHDGKFNGSVWTTTGGYRPDVWSDFSVEACENIPNHGFANDQAWLEYKLAAVAGAYTPAADGVYAIAKPGWPKQQPHAPANARIVAFPGARDPAQFTHLPFVRRHWLGVA